MAPWERARSTAASTSSSRLIPLEIMTGSPDAIMRSSRLPVVTSPEATFQASTPTRSSSSYASSENGELRKASPRSLAWDLSSTHWLSLNSILRQ